MSVPAERLEQRISWCWCLCIVCTVDVVLLQIAVKTGSDIKVVEQCAMAGIRRVVMIDRAVRMVQEFPFQFRCPSWRRCEREVLRIGIGVQELGIYIRESV